MNSRKVHLRDTRAAESKYSSCNMKPIDLFRATGAHKNHSNPREQLEERRHLKPMIFHYALLVASYE